jgi:hypothetical protein
MSAPNETIEIRRSALDALTQAAVGVVRRNGGATGRGVAELVSGLDGVVRDVASADLRARLDEKVPTPVPEEEVVDG